MRRQLYGLPTSRRLVFAKNLEFNFAHFGVSCGRKEQRYKRPEPSYSVKAAFNNNNLLLIEREGRTGEYWPEVERSEVRTKTTEGQYSPVRLELARLVSSLLYGTWTMLVLNLAAFESKKYAAYDRFHGNGPYGEIPTKKEPIRTLGFALPYNNKNYNNNDNRIYSKILHLDWSSACLFVT